MWVHSFCLLEGGILCVKRFSITLSSISEEMMLAPPLAKIVNVTVYYPVLAVFRVRLLHENEVSESSGQSGCVIPSIRVVTL